jgi:hypothetical protein
LPASPPLPTSCVGGRDQVKRLLGEGGKNKVYPVHDTVLDRLVAFSLIKTEGLDEVGLERVRREARVMGRLGGHPHIVAIHDLGEEESQPFIVAELMAGGDVEALIRRPPDHRPPLADGLTARQGARARARKTALWPRSIGRPARLLPHPRWSSVRTLEAAVDAAGFPASSHRRS